MAAKKWKMNKTGGKTIELSTFTLTRSRWMKMKCLMRNVEEKKNDFSIWIFNARAVLLSTSLSLSHSPIFNCNAILRAAFLLVHQLLHWLIFYCFLRLHFFDVWSCACMKVTLFNLRIQQRVLPGFFVHLLNMATSAESYHYKSKHCTHSFKRLLKTFRAKRYSCSFLV